MLVQDECFGMDRGPVPALCGLATSSLRVAVAVCQCFVSAQEASAVVTRGTLHFLSAVLVLNDWMWLTLSAADQPRHGTEQMNSIPLGMRYQPAVAKARDGGHRATLVRLRGDLRKLRECALGVAPAFGQCCLSVWAAILALGGCIKPGLVLLWILYSYARRIILSTWAPVSTWLQEDSALSQTDMAYS